MTSKRVVGLAVAKGLGTQRAIRVFLGKTGQVRMIVKMSRVLKDWKTIS